MAGLVATFGAGAMTNSIGEIRDADFAKETAELIRGQLLEQAAIQMLKFAAEIPKAALSLMPGARTVRPA